MHVVNAITSDGSPPLKNLKKAHGVYLSVKLHVVYLHTTLTHFDVHDHL